jgi:hypothetical protein
MVSDRLDEVGQAAPDLDTMRAIWRAGYATGRHDRRREIARRDAEITALRAALKDAEPAALAGGEGK